MIFRINLKLRLIVLFKSLFYKLNEKQTSKLNHFFLKRTNKKYCDFTSYGRVGLIFLLDYFKKRFPKKNHLIVPSYYLPEMVNIVYAKNFNVSFCDVRLDTFEIDLSHIKKLINKNTIGVILPNIFRSFKKQNEILNFLKKKKILTIEDCAISFDNFKINRGKKIYSGQKSDFCIYSFNIMKEVSCFYGGAILYNDKNFKYFLNDINKNLKKFSNIILFKQFIIYLVLKLLAVRLFFLAFLPIFKKVYEKKISFFLKKIYPSLNYNKSAKLQNNYFTRPHFLFLRLLHLQTINRKSDNFTLRKKINIYYYKKLKLINSKKIIIPDFYDFNFQNYLDFPILVDDQYRFHKFFIKRDIELRLYHYYNCEKIFSKKTTCKKSEILSNQLVCLPNHNMITYAYVDNVINLIKKYLRETN